MAVERTLILAKPDAVERSLAGEIVARFERRGMRLRAARLVVASRELGEAHYAEHVEKPFFGELVDFITSGPTLAFVLEGEGAIATARKTIGATNPADADPGSLRGEFALAMPNNLVHGSDSRRVRRARDRPLVPRWAGLRTRLVTATSGRSRTRSTPTPRRRRSGPWTRSPGACGTCRSPSIGVIGDLTGLDVVELGCGTAYMSAVFAKLGARPVGVDITPAQLETARRLMAETGIEFPLVEADAGETGLPDASFDLVFSEYGASIWIDQERFAAESARLLRPGGRLVFMSTSTACGHVLASRTRRSTRPCMRRSSG